MNKLIGLFDDFPLLDIGDYQLRRVELVDCEDIYDIYCDDEVMKFQGEAAKSNLGQINKFLEFVDSGFKRKYFIRWAVEDKLTQKVIGLISFHHIDYKNNNAQIGYILNRSHWGKGITSFIIKEVMEYLFEEVKLHKLETSVHPDNLASIRVAEKVGFAKEGFRSDCVYNPALEKYESRVIMGIINQ